VEALFALADAVEPRIEAGRVRAERLTQAILAKAFRGELVTTEAQLAREEGRPYESERASRAYPDRTRRRWKWGGSEERKKETSHLNSRTREGVSAAPGFQERIAECGAAR
jgi:hypothetical protein